MFYFVLSSRLLNFNRRFDAFVFAIAVSLFSHTFQSILQNTSLKKLSLHKPLNLFLIFLAFVWYLKSVSVCVFTPYSFDYSDWLFQLLIVVLLIMLILSIYPEAN